MPSASCLQLLRAQGLGYAWEPREDTRQQHRDVPGPAQEALGALLQRQGAEKTACSHRYCIQSRGANRPQPNLHTLCQHRAMGTPHSEGPREGPSDEPHYPEHHQRGPGLQQGSGQGLLTPQPPPRVSTLATLKESPCLGPFPQIHRKTDSLTEMQWTSGQARHTISGTGSCTRWTHRAQEGMTHRRSTVKSLEKLA